MSRSRNWCFTAYEEKDEKDFLEWKPDLPNTVVFFHFQYEKCPTTEKIHIQGMICMKNAQAMTGIKKILGRQSVHLEQMKGKPEQSYIYCTKPETKFKDGITIGKLPQQGQRTDLMDLKKDCDEGMTIQDIADKHFSTFLYHDRSIISYILTKVPARAGQIAPEVFVYYGKPGTGKTRKAFNQVLHTNYYFKDHTKWWNGYSGQEWVIIDDYDGSGIPYRELLMILDRYPHKIEYKGGVMELGTTKFIITSNRHPMYWFPAEIDELGWDENITPLKRRITHLEEIK